MISTLSCLPSVGRWVQDTPTLVHIIPRPGAPANLQPRTFTAPPAFIFHHGNG